jgi:hypothetical protein
MAKVPARGSRVWMGRCVVRLSLGMGLFDQLPSQLAQRCPALAPRRWRLAE